MRFRFAFYYPLANSPPRRARSGRVAAGTASHSLSVNPEELKLNHQFRRHENGASRPARYFCHIHDEQYGA